MNFQGFLKQSTAVTVTILMVDSSDHITGKTGLAAGLTVYQSKAGAATGAITPTSVTEIDSTNAKGLYALALNTTSWTGTLGEMMLHITATGADPADYKWWVTARLPDDLAWPATTGRSMVVDAAGLVDANTVKLGPTGSGTAQTARDIGTSVLLSSGVGTGQLSISAGIAKVDVDTIKTNPVVNGGTITFPTTATLASTTNITSATGVDITKILGTAISTPATAGILDVNVKNIDNDAASASGTVTFPNATLASTTNITAGAITTVTNLTNAPTAGDLTATMKTSVTTAATAATPVAASVTGAVGSVTGLTASNLDTTVSSRLAASTSLTEGYAPDGSAATLQQILYMILQNVQEFAISGTTLTVKKLDGSTTAMTYTLDSSTAPTSKTRAT